MLRVQEFSRHGISGKAKFGVQAFADAMLVIPKTLAENSGLDAQVYLELFQIPLISNNRTASYAWLRVMKKPKSQSVWIFLRESRCLLQLKVSTSGQIANICPQEFGTIIV